MNWITIEYWVSYTWKEIIHFETCALMQRTKMIEIQLNVDQEIIFRKLWKCRKFTHFCMFCYEFAKSFRPKGRDVIFNKKDWPSFYFLHGLKSICGQFFMILNNCILKIAEKCTLKYRCQLEVFASKVNRYFAISKVVQKMKHSFRG